jgi:AcrR family transcriptional regulator
VTVVERTFAEAKPRAGADHVLTAVRLLAIDRGLDVTMDDLAAAAGVSRRTLFRHFESRERLLAAAFAAGMTEYGHRLPDFDGDLDSWLRRTCEEAHRMNKTIGPGFWELTSRADLPSDLAATERRRRRGFRRAVARIAATAWRAAGHDGEPPDALTQSIGAQLSPHFTAAVVDDLGDGWQLAATLAYDAILGTLRQYDRA